MTTWYFQLAVDLLTGATVRCTASRRPFEASPTASPGCRLVDMFGTLEADLDDAPGHLMAAVEYPEGTARPYYQGEPLDVSHVFNDDNERVREFPAFEIPDPPASFDAMPQAFVAPRGERNG